MTTTASTFRALSLLEHEYQPTLHRRAPYWRPRPVPASREAHLPAWNWIHDAWKPGQELMLTTVDAIAAFVSAASSASFAHGALEQTGALGAYDLRPGYYRINSHQWSDSRIVSPLGSAHLPDRIWVATPTLELLLQLSGAGHWPGVEIYDSYTCPASVRFRQWATAVNNARVEALSSIRKAWEHGTAEDVKRAEDWYEEIKTGYSMAVQLMRGPAEGAEVKSAVKRPDWYDTIHAQHAATTWRKVWRCVQAGYVPVSMGTVDEVSWLSEDYMKLSSTTAPGGRPLLSIDPNGIQLGAWKVKGEGLMTR